MLFVEAIPQTISDFISEICTDTTCHAHMLVSGSTPIPIHLPKLLSITLLVYRKFYLFCFIYSQYSSMSQETFNYKLVYYTSNFIIMYFDVLILEDVTHTWILCVFDRKEKLHDNGLKT